MSSTDPSIDCDCRQKSIRNARIIAVISFFTALVLSTRDFGPALTAAYAGLAGLALAIYGVATLFDTTATFPKWLYAGIAILGAALAAYHGISLL